eukprot:jgi/Mesvir1/13611/Mv05139-RA.1
MEPAGRSIRIGNREYPLYFRIREGKKGGVDVSIPFPRGYPNTPLKRAAKRIGVITVEPDENRLLVFDFAMYPSIHSKYGQLATEEEKRDTKGLGKSMFLRAIQLNVKYNVIGENDSVQLFADGSYKQRHKDKQVPLLITDKKKALDLIKKFPLSKETYDDSHAPRTHLTPIDPLVFASTIMLNLQLVEMYKKFGMEVKSLDIGELIPMKSTPATIFKALGSGPSRQQVQCSAHTRANKRCRKTAKFGGLCATHAPTRN